MARQPFFSGNYGSALGQIDTRPIMQGAAAQAAMYQGLGQNIGGAIEKYGLNKEREKKANARIKASVQGLDSYVEAGVITDADRLQAMEMLQNPDVSSSEKVAFIDQQEKRLFQLPKALLAKAQAGNAVLQNEITERTKDFEVKNRELSNDLLKSQGVLAALKTSGFTKEQKAALENLEAQTLSVIADTSKTIAETAEIPKTAKTRDELAKATIALKKKEVDASAPDADDWKDAEEQVAAAKLKNVDLVFGRNPKGEGLVITSMKGDIESLGKKLPDFPDHLLYGGSFYDLSGKKPVKVGVEDIMTIPKMNIAAVNALMDEVTTDYLRHKQLGELNDDGYYVMDLGDGDKSQVLQSVAMDQKVFQILRLQEGIAEPVDLDLTTR
mgnify:CR=1 FL=1